VRLPVARRRPVVASDSKRRPAADGRAESHEGSAFGAALLGMEALGVIESFAVAADLLPIEEASEPDAEAAAVYAELLPVFAGLYDALGPTFRALRRLQR
jgi:gluconokinase